MKKNNIISISIAAIILLLTQLFWWNGNNIISGADFALSGFSGISDFFKNIHTWNETQYWGTGNFFNTSLIIWDLFFALFEYIRVPIQIIERILFGFILIGGFFGIQKFLREQNLKNNIWIIGAIYYSVNLFTIIAWHNLIIFVLLAYSLLPWFLFLIKKILTNNGKSKEKDIIYFISLTLLASPIAQNPPTVLGILVLPILIYGGFLIVSQVNKKINIKRSLILILFTIFLHSWWLLPSIYGSLNFTTEAPVADLTASLTRNTEHLTELNILNLGGHWGLYETNLEGNKNIEYGNYYTDTNSIGKYIGILFPLLALLSLFTNKNYKKSYWWFWFVFAGIFFFLSQGPNGLTGKLFIWATHNIPGFWMFRSPEYKFLPGFIIAITALLGTIDCTKETIKKYGIPLLILLMTSANIIYAYPFFTNYLFEPEHQIQDAKNIYADFLDWQKSQDSKTRLYITPQQKGVYLHYTWGYEGIDPSIHVINLSSGGITESTRNSSLLATYINTELYRGKKTDVLRYLWNITGTTHILQRNDTDYEIYPKHLLQNSPEEIQERLENMDGISLQANLGSWDIYSINESNAKIQAHADTQFYTTNTKLFAEKITEKQNTDQLFTRVKEEKFIPEDSRITIMLPTYDAKNIHENNGWIIQDGSIVTSQEHHKNAEITYDFFIPQTGEYTISTYIKPGNKDAQIVYKINDEEYSQGILSPKETNDDPFDFVKEKWNNKKLQKGNYTITLQNTAPEGTKGLQEIEAIVIEKLESKNISNPPEIEYNQISSTRWEVNIKDTENPYFITLLESYHPGWTAYIEKNGQKTKIQNTKHYTSYEFANSWYIEDGEAKKIIITFWPQKLFYIGSVMSIFTIILLIVSLKIPKKS